MAISMHVLDYEPPPFTRAPARTDQHGLQPSVSLPLGHRVNCLFTSSPILPPEHLPFRHNEYYYIPATTRKSATATKHKKMHEG